MIDLIVGFAKFFFLWMIFEGLTGLQTVLTNAGITGLG